MTDAILMSHTGRSQLHPAVTGACPPVRSSGALSLNRRSVGRALSAQRERERRASARLSLRPDAPDVAAHDALHRREADPRAGVFADVVQPLEGPEELVDVAAVEARAVVSHEEGLPPVFDGLADLAVGRGAAGP